MFDECGCWCDDVFVMMGVEVVEGDVVVIVCVDVGDYCWVGCGYVVVCCCCVK